MTRHVVAFLLAALLPTAFSARSTSTDRTLAQSGGPSVLFPSLPAEPEVPCSTWRGDEGSCKSVGGCVFRFESSDQLDRSSCRMGGGRRGICCPKRPPTDVRTIEVHPIPDTPILDFGDNSDEEMTYVQALQNLEEELRRRGLVAKKGSLEYFSAAFFAGDQRKVSELNYEGLAGVDATQRLVKTLRLDLEGMKKLGRNPKSACPSDPECPLSKYREADGSCNNKKHPRWGATFRPYARLLPPAYADGISSARLSSDGGPLPSAREVSSRVISTSEKHSKKVTYAFALWAHFLAYDISRTGITTEGKGGAGLVCCHPELQETPRLKHPACMPIFVAEEDPLRRRLDSPCMHFVRSAVAPRADCNFGPREQLNQVTAFIDGSSIYGISEEKTRQMRTLKNGFLRWAIVNEEEMLPVNSSRTCASKSSPCFSTGDSRSNCELRLSLLQTLLLREHNRLAEGLRRLHSGWSDEALFQEARRILVAQIQHVTYSEFLPLLLGKKVMSSYELFPKLSGFSFDYDPEMDADVTNVFATAANRFGYTLVQDFAELRWSQTSRMDSVLPKEFDPTPLQREGAFDALARGLVEQPAADTDTHVSYKLRDELFGGADVVSLSVQRGRDHGLAGYSAWREHCGLPALADFRQLHRVMDPLAATNLSRLYTSVRDVDLYVAGLAEKPLPDGLLGPTFACLVADQFRRLKLGDRFWYENEGVFSDAQLQEIRKVTFSSILCDNSNVEEVQLVSFIHPAVWNPFEDCRSGKIPKMRLSAWKNERPWT